MSKIISNAIIFIFISSLTSCGWLGIRDRSGDYLLAEETEPTAVPVEIDCAGLGQASPGPLYTSEPADDPLWVAPCR